MVKNGLDVKAYTARLKTMSPEQRAETQARFWAWAKEGTRKNNQYSTVAICLWGAAAMLTIVATAWTGWTQAAAFAAAGIAALVGIPLFQVSARRERHWREANPFEVE